MIDDLRRELARSAHRLGPLADRLRWFDEVASTNDVALTLAAAGADEGLVVAAGAQSAGKGRLGRHWSSPPGAGLYVSIVLRPPPDALPLLTLTAGVGVADGIEAATGLSAALKWPNDLYVRGTDRKLGGILAERAAASTNAHVVLGFGVNIRPAVHDPVVAARAASIEGELGRPVDFPLLFVECLAAVWRRYNDLRDHRGAAVLDEWRRRAESTMGRAVEWDVEDGIAQGVAEGVDDGGALIVRTPAGIVRIISGEVRWRVPSRPGRL